LTPPARHRKFPYRARRGFTNPSNNFRKPSPAFQALCKEEVILWLV